MCYFLYIKYNMSSTQIYDRIYREFKDIKVSLKPQKMSIFEELIDLFNELSETLQSLFIDFFIINFHI